LDVVLVGLFAVVAVGTLPVEEEAEVARSEVVASVGEKARPVGANNARVKKGNLIAVAGL
jgi:hypothetical protein